MADDDISLADARNDLEQARDALADAHVLIDADGSTNGIVNRLYYACFHAARAALYARQINPGSHGGVRTQFGQQIIVDGDAPREMGRLLSDLYDYRHEADYGHDTPDLDLDTLVDDVERFIDHIETLV